MKWNIAYRIYEGIAFTVIILCFTTNYRHYHTDTESLYYSLETARKDNLITPGSSFFKDVLNDLLSHHTQRELQLALPEFHQFCRMAQKTIVALERHKKYLGQYAMDETIPVSRYFIKQKQGYHIKQLLDAYIDTLNKKGGGSLFSLPKFEKLFEKRSLNYKNQWSFVDKNSVNVHFSHTTVAEAFMLLTWEQHVVTRYALEILRKYRGYSDAYLDYGCGPTPIVKGVFQEQTHVQVGDYLEADLVACKVFAHWAKRREFYAEVNGQRVTPQKDGCILVKFKANGQGKQYWTGTIRYYDKGIKHTQTVKVPYWVK